MGVEVHYHDQRRHRLQAGARYRPDTQEISFGRTYYIGSTSPLISRIKVDLWFTINKGCTWDVSDDDCHRYLKVPVNSCNCGSVDAKQGGIVKNNCVRWRIDPNSI
ncbi:hypothetical protein QBC46DRAFT_389339 [Diplogelasinospora grovesii]|uniref:Uncharacterized protein n=1 Tax=Diplogelasinospora grovesii TaxID=303347 RepID=A0AAN6N7P5_9PEZI|nr:hypothetical protein QBC46DRAFT_389339 [Diplogelasinospora grovesii]